MIITDIILTSINKEINNILVENSLNKNTLIRRTIFELLEKSGSLIFHSFNNDSLWGAYFMKDNNNFFIINSGIELEKQIFAAAHELAHSLDIARIESEVLTVKSITEYPKNNGDITKVEKCDLIANRFAAELLVNKTLLLSEIDSLPKFLSYEEICVFLSHTFLVPYGTIVRRLKEIGKINDEIYNRIYKTPLEIIREYEDIYGICSENHIVTNINKYANFASKVISHYKNKLSTYDELKKRLKLIDKSPEQYGIFPDQDLTESYFEMEIDE